jgi:ubiquitin C-terminal hydrolase
MGSVLQALFHTHEYREFVLKEMFHDASAGASLQVLFSRLLNEDDSSAESVVDLTNTLGVNEYLQEDAHEFLLEMLDLVDRSTISGTSLSSVFSGEFEQFIRCTEVDFNKTRLDRFLDISVDILGASNLSDAIHSLTSAETLSGENRYNTPTFGLQTAEKGLRIKVLPNNAFFHLKRFSYDYETEKLMKVNNHFTFPLSIDLSEFTVGNHDVADIFVLRSIILHQGSATMGHYYCLVRADILGSPNKWLRFNDHDVSEVHFDDVEIESFGGDDTGSKSAYILQYVRKDSL